MLSWATVRAFSEIWDSSRDHEAPFRQDGDHPLNMGIALVTPAQQLVALLMDETEAKERRRKDREWDASASPM